MPEDRRDKEAFFKGLLKPDKWKPFDEYARDADSQLEKDLAAAEDKKRQMHVIVRRDLEKDFSIKRQDPARLAWANAKLYEGAVCAVDGTHSMYPLVTGMRAQIGVAATSYLNNRIDHVLYVFEPEMEFSEADVYEIIHERAPEERFLTALVVRAAMSFTERRIALDRPEAWKFIQGSLVPYELRVGAGKFRTLPPCLEIAAKIVQNKKAVGVIGKTANDELMTLAMALNEGEYVALKTLRNEIDKYLENAHFSEDDRQLVEWFAKEHASKVVLGAYKVGPKAYLFEAHEETFDDAAHLVMADALHQPMRGYPLLIDYADSICKRLLSSSDFEKKITYKLAKLGSWAQETPERATRRR